MYTPGIFPAFVVTLACFASPLASAQSTVKVAEPVWSKLAQPERDNLQKAYQVDVIDAKSYGVIIDHQAVDESTDGTTVGAQLGSAIGNATYVDNAIKSRSYSARNQLAAGLLGAIIGSLLDSKPNPQFHVRYAVRLGNGDVRYIDEIKQEPFRHPIGICVSVPDMALIDQALCNQTVETLRTLPLSTQAPEPATIAPLATGEKSPEQRPTVAELPNLAQINCKLGQHAPVKTTAEKCRQVRGTLVDD